MTDLSVLLPSSPYRDAPKEPMTQDAATTAQHVQRLRIDSQLQKAFWVQQVAGKVDSKQTIYLIPQYHRSPNKPLDWTSLGAEIREVQINIDTLMTHLFERQGLRCVGTEGSSAARLQRNPELVQLARWYQELHQSLHQANQQLGDENQVIQPTLTRLSTLLEDQLAARAMILDGVGLAMARKTHPSPVARFGLEDPALNQHALALLAKITTLQEERDQMDPQTQPEVASAVGTMWLEEYPAFQDEVLIPMQSMLVTLDAARRGLLQEGADDASKALGRVVSLAKMLRTRLVKPDEIDGYTAYYEALEKTLIEQSKDPTQSAKTSVPAKYSRRQKRRLMAIDQRLQRLNTQYEEVTFKKRNAQAVSRLLKHLPAHGSCAMVMGAQHQQGLLDVILQTTKGQVGVVVVAPFHFEEAS